jgi:hypothetical protein
VAQELRPVAGRQFCGTKASTHADGNLAARLNAAGASQERDQGGGKGRTAAVVLTSGRRCSRSRIGVDVHVGEVGIHSDGTLPAPAS